jgi:hypothetical protein
LSAVILRGGPRGGEIILTTKARREVLLIPALNPRELDAWTEEDDEARLRVAMYRRTDELAWGGRSEAPAITNRRYPVFAFDGFEDGAP